MCAPHVHRNALKAAIQPAHRHNVQIKETSRKPPLHDACDAGSIQHTTTSSQPSAAIMTRGQCWRTCDRVHVRMRACTRAIMRAPALFMNPIKWTSAEEYDSQTGSVTQVPFITWTAGGQVSTTTSYLSVATSWWTCVDTNYQLSYYLFVMISWWQSVNTNSPEVSFLTLVTT